MKLASVRSPQLDNIVHVKCLLENGADINRCDQNGFNPLYVACAKGHDNTVQLLQSFRVDINSVIEGGVSPVCGLFLWK